MQLEATVNQASLSNLDEMPMTAEIEWHVLSSYMKAMALFPDPDKTRTQLAESLVQRGILSAKGGYDVYDEEFSLCYRDNAGNRLYFTKPEHAEQYRQSFGSYAKFLDIITRH